MRTVFFWSKQRLWMLHCVLAVGLLLITQACGQESSTVAIEAVPIHVLHQAQHCAVEKPGIFQIRRQDELENYFRKTTIGKPLQIPAIRFDKATALLVAAGRLPSTAYQLNVVDSGAHQIASTLSLPVRVEKSSADRHAQMVTQPCVLIVMPKGSYQRVEALQGQVSLQIR